MYEESLRVPLLVRWPGLPAGRVPSAFALNIDLAPTFLDIAGLPVPPGVQGASLGPMLHDRLPIEWRQVMYYRYYEYPGTHSVPQHWGVRSHTHKLIWYPELKAWEMFNVEKDPHELNNAIADPEQQGYRQHLEGELQHLRAALGDDDQVKVR
jgi:arylsulfatase A-like enzyme